MKKTFLSSFIFSLLIGTAAFAENQHGMVMPNRDAPQTAASEVVTTEGYVKKVDQKAGKVTIRHGEIANVGMPAMTMTYSVKYDQELQAIHAGDKVRFAMEKKNDDYIVTHIELSK